MPQLIHMADSLLLNRKREHKSEQRGEAIRRWVYEQHWSLRRVLPRLIKISIPGPMPPPDSAEEPLTQTLPTSTLSSILVLCQLLFFIVEIKRDRKDKPHKDKVAPIKRSICQRSC